jgi:hypothetical protein
MPYTRGTPGDINEAILIALEYIAAHPASVGDVTLSPTGLATAAIQATQQTSLTSIDGKLPALGQAAAGASVPVVLPTSTVGTAGTAAADVLSIQGKASMTPVLVNGGGAAGTANAGVVSVQGIANMTALAVNGGGSAGSANAGVVTVQGVANMTPVQVAGTDTIGTPGSKAFTVQGGGTSGALTVAQSTAANLKVSLADTAANSNALKMTGGGSAGSADTGVLTVQGIASGTVIPVGQATAANLKVSLVDTASNTNALKVIGGDTIGTPGATAMLIQGATGGSPVPVLPLIGTVPTNTYKTLGTETDVLLAANSKRTTADITNGDPAAVLWLGIGAAAVVGSGQPVYPHQTFEINSMNLNRLAINGISTAAGMNVAIFELATA